jgi:hypothetical protein
MREAASLREERVRNIVVREEEDGYYKTLKSGEGRHGGGVWKEREMRPPRTP